METPITHQSAHSDPWPAQGHDATLWNGEEEKKHPTVSVYYNVLIKPLFT